jgi:hypothetical protein
VTCNMSYASKWEYDRFPETFVGVEGSAGGVTLGPDYILKVTTSAGSDTGAGGAAEFSVGGPGTCAESREHRRVQPESAGSAAQRGEGRAETTGEDNLKPSRLVFGAHESAAERKVLRLK